MKKEITSFVIGAGIVGAFWAGTAFCKNESKNTTPVSEQKINEKQSNLLKKTLTDIYFATPNKNFPGLELTDTDFLVPFNRMDFKGERIYTRAEFIKKFDEIFYPEYKEFVLKSDASEIWYSWRGAGLPDRCSWCASGSKRVAGPLSLYTDKMVMA